MRDLNFFLCFLSLVDPGFWNGRKTLVKSYLCSFHKILVVQGVLAQGTGISWFRISFSIGVTVDGSKSSSPKVRRENRNTPFLEKAAVKFFAVKRIYLQHF